MFTKKSGYLIVIFATSFKNGNYIFIWFSRWFFGWCFSGDSDDNYLNDASDDYLGDASDDDSNDILDDYSNSSDDI